MSCYYNVVLSFADEDIYYIEATAEVLKVINIHVFYDKYEEIDLWGKDLCSHLEDVYQKNQNTVRCLFQNAVKKGYGQIMKGKVVRQEFRKKRRIYFAL